jgi:endonuclease G
VALDEITGEVRLALRLAVREYLCPDDNVTAVDFGLPEHDGEIATDERAVRVHVRRKLPVEVLEASGVPVVEREILGFQTDVVEGTYRPELWWNPVGAWPHADPRASRGISISDSRHYAAGTLGTRVIDRATGAEMILSNWHVLVADWAGRPGQPIFQPGRLDGGTAVNTIAGLTRDAMASNLDAAVATLTGNRRIVNDQLGLGPITGIGAATHGLRLVKSGRTSGITRGVVTGLSGVAQIAYAGIPRTIRHVITIDPFMAGEVSRPGDSGSIWLADSDRQAVGLHFAGGDAPERGLAIDIATVLDALDVKLDPGTPIVQVDSGPSVADVTFSIVRNALAAYA